jgi:UDP-N-acetylglucosamine--N-acetylmuramyl-(pentapeptide) pyrophosphoryl-undecaprenol N-acetylglucosamine transferase
LQPVRLLASGGGTGGHVYPVLAVVQEWRNATAARRDSGNSGTEGDLPALEEVLYVGTAGGLEASIVPRAGIALRTVQAAAMRGLSPLRMLANGVTLLRGMAQAWRILRDFRPDVVLATGGYASVPVAVAAWLRRCPLLVYLPDAQPGLAVRFLSRLATRVAVSFDAALAYFDPAKTAVTGYPVRPALLSGIESRPLAHERLGLARGVKTLLILGGSRGAHSVNVAVNESLEKLLSLAQIIHVAGEADNAWLEEQRDKLPVEVRQRYHLYPYLHEEMVPALLAADLAVARAGAATMGEFAAVGLPSILVPYPYSGQHQEANADFLASHGAAVKLLDAGLVEGTLLQAVQTLFRDEDALRSMAESARQLARPDAARAIARELASLAVATASRHQSGGVATASRCCEGGM